MGYRKIVFGLKDRRRLYEFPDLLKLLHFRSVIISEHDAARDYCERPGLHYHGIVEQRIDTDLKKDVVFSKLKAICNYFKSELCCSPETYYAYLVKPPKIVMVIEVAHSDLRNIACVFHNEERSFGNVEMNQFDKEVVIKMIIQFILTKGICDLQKITAEFEGKDFYRNWSVEEFDGFVKQSISVANMKVQNELILDLCSRIQVDASEYYTIKESAELVIEWCLFQDIIIEEFTKDWIECLDRSVSRRNALYFQGSARSGIRNIIYSIGTASISVGLINEESTGFTYVWQNCLERRLIILNEPHYDERMFDKLENILEGTGTFVPHPSNVLRYLRPTPVVICARNHGWESDSHSSQIQSRFIKSYMNLKPFAAFNNLGKKLHPGWLKVLYEGTMVEGILRWLNDNSLVATSSAISSESPVGPEDGSLVSRTLLPLPDDGAFSPGTDDGALVSSTLSPGPEDGALVSRTSLDR